MLTQAEQDAYDLLYQMLNHPEEDPSFDGRSLSSLVSLEDRRMKEAVGLLVAVGALKEVPYGGGPISPWKNATYYLEPKASLVRNSLGRGDNPFRLLSVGHSGDNYNMHVNSNSGAIAMGRGATANYLNGSAEGKQVAELFQQMRDVIDKLPKSAKSDGEHQLQKLSEAAQEGSESLADRKSSFMGYLHGLKDGGETATAMMTLYDIAVVLFGIVGVTLPTLPEGL